MSPRPSSGQPVARTLSASLALSLSLVLVACSDDGGGGTGDGAGGGNGEGPRIAAVLSGSTTDADYNALGLLALEQAEAAGAEITYSESVQVADAERVMTEYLADEYDVIWTHGSQFYEATSELAADYPDVTFIGEFDGEPADQPDNVWVIDRNFHLAFYAVGVLADALTTSGEIGYVGGASLPFSYSEVHAMEQAISDAGSDSTVRPVWTGDFNDPSKAQQISTQLVGDGADVIVGSLNLGAVGTFQALEGTPVGTTWTTAKYTDKSSFGADHYAGSVIYDFAGPLEEILAEIADGTTTGYYPLGFDTGVTLHVGDGVPAEATAATEEVLTGLQDGSITVERDVEPIE